MNPWWLLFPYSMLIPIEGARLFLVEQCLESYSAQNNTAQLYLYRFHALDIAWYKWLLRTIKDWLVLAILTGIAVSGLSRLEPRITVALFFLLGLLVLWRSYAPFILLLYSAGFRIPESILTSAVQIALPDFVPAGRKRVVRWSVAFVLTGAANFWVWAISNNSGSLLLGFFILTLGFISLLRGVTYKRNMMEDNANAEKAG